MKAIGFNHGGGPDVLVDLDLPMPTAVGRDLLVEVRAISVNPVDTKVRRNDPDDGYRVLGWDVAGVVRSVGPDVTMFVPGDRVFYAGDVTRAGANSEFHLVDERIAATAPVSLDSAGVAALPLTAITAWELLFDRLQVAEGTGTGDALLVIGAAGGVGSLLVQLATQLTDLQVIATASRPESELWVRSLGVTDVIDHRRGLVAALQEIGGPPVRYIAALTRSGAHWSDMCEVIEPRGSIAMIDDPGWIDVGLLKQKSGSLHWEFMFTRPLFGTDDMVEQHRLLSRVRELVDAGTIRSTAQRNFGVICAENLRAAHEHIETGRTVGKVVLEGWPD